MSDFVDEVNDPAKLPVRYQSKGTHIDYRPTLTGSKFHNSNNFVRGIVGPIGSAKSVTCVMEILRRACQQAPNEEGIRETRCVVTRNTMKQIRKTTLATFLKWLPHGKAGKFYKSDCIFHIGWDDDNRPTRLMLKDGTFVHCEVIFSGMETPDQVDDLLSFEPTFAYSNEFREMDFAVFTALVSRLGRFPGGDSTTWDGWFGDSNMFDTKSPWYGLFHEKPSEALMGAMAKIGKVMAQPELFRQPGGLSPMAENIENLPGATKQNPEGGRAYYLRLMQVNRDPNWINMHVNAEFGYLVKGMAVYQGYFNSRVHAPNIRLIPDPTRAIVVGIDFGMDAAAVFAQRLDNGQWLVLGEVIAENKSTADFARMITHYAIERGWSNNLVCWADPTSGSGRSQAAGLKTNIDICRANGLTIQASPDRSNSIETRLNCVKQALSRSPNGDAGVLCDPSCDTLIRGFLGAYHYEEKRGSVEDPEHKEKPEKDHYSNVHDAFQYAVLPYEYGSLKGGYTAAFPGNEEREERGRPHNMLTGVSAWR